MRSRHTATLVLLVLLPLCATPVRGAPVAPRTQAPAKAGRDRRVEVRHGEGLARVELDAFDGRVSLTAVDAEAPDPCEARGHPAERR